MKIDKIKVGNAFALATAILWVVCTVVVWLFPGFSLAVLNWWMHGMNMVVMGGWGLTIANFFLGGVSAVVSAWVVGYVLAWSFEKVK